MKTTKLICFGASCLLAYSCTDSAEQQTEGKIKREYITVTTKVPGRVETLKVQEGDFVKKGDTLAILDIPEVDAKVEQAEGAALAATAQYQMAEAGATANQLKQLQAKHDALKEQFLFAQKSFARMEAMFADSLISPQSYDEAFTKLQGARAQYNAVSAELDEAIAGVRSESKLMALGQKEQAGGALREAKVASGERYIIAPADMTIETISLQTGELATPGYTIFNGTLPQSTWFRFTFPESQIGKIQQDGTYEINVPYLKETIPCRVTLIRQLPQYATITTAYPNYELEEAVYEVKMLPQDPVQADKLLNNATVILK